MASFRTAIENSFEELGVVYDKAVLDKCVELCLDHGVDDADELVDSWMAFSVSHLQGENPTAAHLAKFEREVLSKRARRKEKSANDSTLIISEFDSPGVLSDCGHTPKRKLKTPDGSGVPRGRLAVSPRGPYSPASFSPMVVTPSSRYIGRKNAGSVICERTLDFEESYLNDSIPIQIISSIPQDQKFMTYHLSDIAENTEIHMSKLISQLAERFSLDDILPVSAKHPTNIVVAGRVVCDADGKLNAESLLLEGSPESGGEIIKLDLSGVPEYSVFPGQVLAVEGLNISGGKMSGRSIFYDAAIPEPPPKVQLPGCLKIIVACGPLTTTDSLTYQPLVDLLEVVQKEDPHILLLTGPVLDANHSAVVDGLVAETFQDIFDRLIDQILASVEGKRTQVVLLSSYRESHGAMVFPTPPVVKKEHPKLSVLSDPAVFSIQDFTIAATSVDILMHIGKEEVSHPPHSGDRLARLAGHLIKQQSFYPLKPPAAGVPLDPSLESYLQINSTPHLLIAPSDLRCFIKDINGCTVVNPEHLAKGLVGGNYAKLVINSAGIVSGQVIKV